MTETERAEADLRLAGAQLEYCERQLIIAFERRFHAAEAVKRVQQAAIDRPSSEGGL